MTVDIDVCYKKLTYAENVHLYEYNFQMTSNH